ncbi:hypothetical protein BC938DRAFT_470855 [Jimgerdemannia flammicorona]|uniref:Protein CSN12 homolog n=1 Tax=Jimgerdemannia flammicorona TaxID=994334 RepID=A0A433Q9F3_9FUNG|nr:hypothetical protein BC938DRAFT_470855 [Jimgerdemannia flammicorona]
MDLSRYLSQVQAFLNKENGLRLADLLYIRGGHAHHLLDTALEYRPDDLERECRDKIDQQLWDDITLLHIRVLISRGLNDYPSAYTEQAALVQSFLRTFPTLTRWSLPILYTIHNDLWLLANEADEQLKIKGEKGGKLEDAARNINKAFTACITDRWDGTFDLGNENLLSFLRSLDLSTRSTHLRSRRPILLFALVKTQPPSPHPQLKQQNLCKNVLRAVRASDLPGVEQFPKSHRVTYRYYLGVLNFLEEDYKKAEAELMVAFKECHSRAKKNKEWVSSVVHHLTYSPPKLKIPFITHPSLPSLPSYAFTGRSSTSFSRPSSSAACFPRALSSTASHVSVHFTTRSSWQPARETSRSLTVASRAPNGPSWQGELTLLLRGRESLWSGCCFEKCELKSRHPDLNILTRLCHSFNLMDRTTKLPVSVFQQALAFVGMNIDLAEVECMLANMIYKGYIKGYLSHEKMFLVLSSKDPFPSFKEVNGLG